MVKDIVERVVENIVKTYTLLEEITGSHIPEEVLRRVIGEAEHIAIHELSHGAIRTVYPGIDELEEKDPVLGECIDEILSRLLETYISDQIGAYKHSFEEHVYELRNYTSLSNLNIRVEDLEELYKHTSRLFKEKKLRNAIDVVAMKCREWIRENK